VAKPEEKISLLSPRYRSKYNIKTDRKWKLWMFGLDATGSE